MKKLLCLIALMPMFALAATANLTWTKPTQNTDGSALIDGTGYEIYAATTAAGATAANTTPVATVSGINTQTYTLTNLAAGTWYFSMKTVATSGKSAFSTVATATLAPAVALPPTGLSATPVVITATAYKLRQSVDGMQMVAIGSVPLGTQCDAANSVNGYNLVPRAAVKMASSVDTKPLITFAQCG